MAMAVLDPPQVYGYTVFCDDIRQEIGGKFSYIGVYSGFMFVNGSFPITLPKLCLAITFLQRREILDANIGLRIYLPGETDDDAPSIQADLQEQKEGIVAEQTAAEVAGLPKPDISFVAMHAKMLFSPVVITQAGDIRVRAVRKGELIRLGGLRVAMAPAEQPPP
jgi:hypothetical protein